MAKNTDTDILTIVKDWGKAEFVLNKLGDVSEDRADTIRKIDRMVETVRKSFDQACKANGRDDLRIRSYNGEGKAGRPAMTAEQAADKAFAEF